MMATSKARLTSLPTEILSIIFSDESVGSSRGPTLSLTDLGAVRLSCKALQSPATAIFAQRYFQNPYVMIWKESLEALLDICRHPVFGPCVRKIEFLEGDYRSDPALGSADSVYDQDTATELVSRQRNFEKAGAHVKLLAETFKALEVHGIPLEVCVHDHFRPSKEPINMERIVTRHHLECYDMEDRHEGASVIKLVLKASARSGCKINRLTADIISFPHLTPTRVAMPGSAESGEFEVFEELEEITINAIAPRVLITEKNLFDHLVLILAIPKHLRRLELSQSSRFSRRSHDHLDPGRRARWLSVARCIATHLSLENLVWYDAFICVDFSGKEKVRVGLERLIVEQTGKREQ